MGRVQKVTINMYRFLLDRILTEGRTEATFRENLDFEVIPIQDYLAWVEDVAEKICVYNENARANLPRRGPLYEIVEGISHGSDSMTRAENIQASQEANALKKLDQIDKFERKTKLKNKIEMDRL